MDVLIKCGTCAELYLQDENACPYCGGLGGVPKKGFLNEEDGLKCKLCTFTNQINSLICQVCEQDLLGDKLAPPPLKAKYKSVINCPHCNSENSLANSHCSSCYKDLYELKAVEKVKCPICSFAVKKTIFNSHYTDCVLSHDLIMKEVEQDTSEECIHCQEKFPPGELISNHQDQCKKRPKIQKLEVGLLVDEKSRLSKLQMEAMLYMHNKSEKQHKLAKDCLLKKVQGLGFKEQDLENLHFYVSNYAPIIIHIHVSKHMEFFVKDTHYRSQFETNKSSGSLSRTSRTGWEDRMFDKKYSKATDFERCKYGTINFTNDPKGVKCCSGYGPSYFLLKPHVRDRCTFTDMDSSSTNASISTFKYPFKVLSKLNDKQLKAALEGSRAMEVSSSVVTTYKQIQIHGPIEFSKDIERIYVNSKEIKGQKNLLDMVYQFSKKNNVDHDFIST